LWNRDALADHALEQAVKLAPVFPPACRAQMSRIWQHADWDQPTKHAAADELIARARASNTPGLAQELHGLSLLIQNHSSEATEAFGQSLAMGNPSPDLRLTYAQALRAGGNVQAFADELWKLIAQRPKFEPAYPPLFQYYLSQNDGATARRVLATWLTNNPASVSGRLLQATILYRLANQSGAAETMLLEVFREHPDDPQVLSELRAFYAAGNHVERFEKLLEDQCRSRPDNRVALEQLIELYVQQKRSDDAAHVLDSARDAVHSDPDLLYYVAHLYEGIDRKSVTEQLLADVIRIDPKHAAANNDLAFSWTEQGRNLAAAEKMVRIALEEEPDNQSFLDSLGWVLYKRGEIQQAREILERAVAPASFPDPVVLDHLGDALYRLNDRDRAQQNWRRAMQRLSELGDNASRDDLLKLKLALEQKLKQAEQGQSVSVAPIIEK
jgi:predicted Zn-dependent protease